MPSAACTEPDPAFEKLVLSADAFADLFPEHVGLGLDQALIHGIPALGLSGADVTRAIAARIREDALA